MPASPASQTGPILLGHESSYAAAAMRKVTVKNTFIEAEEDPTAAATPASHQRRNTCPGPVPREEADTTPSVGGSAYTESPSSQESGSLRLPVSARERLPHFFPPQEPSSQRDAFRVQNTFISGPDDWTPAAVHRRHVTCPAEPLPEDSQSDGDQDRRNEEDVHSPAVAGGRRVRLSNRRLSGGSSPAGSPVARPCRVALATEDLQEQFFSGAPGLGTMAEDSSPAARPRSRTAQATEDLREVLMAMKANAPTAGSPQHPVAGPSSPQVEVPTSPVYGDGQQCPPGFVPVATACAAVAAVAQSAAATAAWPLMMPHAFHQQQMALAASMYPWPFCASMPPVAPPPVPPMLQSISPPVSPQASPDAMPSFACGTDSSPTSVQQPCPVGLQAAGQTQQQPCAATAPTGYAKPATDASEHVDMLETGRGRGRGPRRLRLWAHIYLHMQLEGFDLVPRLIGRSGCNMRKIAEATGSKVRIRGRGSGHLEIDGKSEAPTPLMVAVTTDRADAAAFKRAIEMTIRELKTVEGRFHAFCKAQGHEHIGPCYSIGLLQPNAIEALGSLLDTLPQSGLPKTSATPGVQE